MVGHASQVHRARRWVRQALVDGRKVLHGQLSTSPRRAKVCRLLVLFLLASLAASTVYLPPPAIAASNGMLPDMPHPLPPLRFLSRPCFILFFYFLLLSVDEQDCLFANVYVPAGTKPTSKMPVMVYLHAGEFRFGASNDQENNWPYLSQGSVILVTFNVRLGLFGFAVSLNLHTRAPTKFARRRRHPTNQICSTAPPPHQPLKLREDTLMGDNVLRERIPTCAPTAPAPAHPHTHTPTRVDS